MENKVLATVNGRKIMDSDVSLLLNSLGQERAQQFQGDHGKKVLLDEIINQTLFLAEAKETNLEETPEFQKELELVKDNVLKQMSINNLMKTVQISEDAAKKYFEQNKAQFKTKEQAGASHILVNDEEKCNSIIKEINADEISFEDAAKKYSSCPSKEKGGDLGVFEKGKMVPEFEEVTFKMEVNEISEPVKTQFGYHIIKLNSKLNKKDMTYADAKNNIIITLTKQEQQKVYMDKIAKLKEKYPVEMK